METERVHTDRPRGMALFLVLLTMGSLTAATAEEPAAPAPAAQTPAAEAIDFSDAEPVIESPVVVERSPLLSAVHLGLGWATLAAGAATGILNPEVSGEELHTALGISAATLAAGTMVVGYLAHRGEVGPKFRLSANNVHALLGAAGGTMMMITPFLAGEDAHKYLGAAGVLLMGVSVGWKIVF